MKLKIIEKEAKPARNAGPKKDRRSITFKVKLTEEQRYAKGIAMDNTITFMKGKPGTSKSTLCCHIALELLCSGMVNKIVVTRPTVGASHDIGFLPGDAFNFKEGKMAPYVAPILQSMYKIAGKDQIDKWIEEGVIEIIPIQFVRGLNFEECVTIVDESQNITADELKAITTRICPGSKMLFTSDVNQIDLRNKGNSASRFVDAIAQLDGVAVVELFENFRDPLAIQIMEMIDEMEDERKSAKLELSKTTHEGVTILPNTLN